RRRESCRSQLPGGSLGRPRRNDRATLDPIGRPRRMSGRRRKARRYWSDPQLSTDRLKLMSLRCREMRCLHHAAAELAAIDGDYGIVDADILERGDVPCVHDGRVVDDDVVHDARAAPSAPEGPTDEADRAPPRKDRLAEPERPPADEWE